MFLRFENPAALWGFLAVGLIVLRLWWKRVHTPFLFSGRRTLTGVLGISLCILALSRPQGGSQVVAQRGEKSTVFLALDISRSMLAEDSSPSRLGLAIVFAQRLLSEISGSRVALYAFAHEGYLMMPLSTDVYAAADLLSTAHPSNTTAQGTDFTKVLEGLFQQIQRAEDKAREKGMDWTPPQVVLLSDGETHEPIDDAALKLFQSARIPIFTVLVGTQTGAQIPVEGRFQGMREPLRDSGGQLVMSRANPESLKKIAAATGGFAFEGQLTQVSSLIQRLRQSMQIGKLSTTFRIEREFFPILLAIALLLFLFEFALGRWELVLRIALFFLVFSSQVAYADRPKDSHARSVEAYNQGLKALNEKDFKKAAELFQESGLVAQEPEVQKKSFYNLGNTLLRMGDPTQALQAYQKALDARTGKATLDSEANRRISENIVLASRMEQEMKQKQKNKSQGEGGESGDSGQGEAPDGPKKYDAEPLTDGMKQRIYDLVSNEEKQTIQRLQDQGRKGQPQTGKPW
jgi:Ca-activated chloride channel homolog